MSRLSCDVLVVGGGMAGISLAAELAPDRDVVVVETESELGRHATGRSAASYLPSYGGPLVRTLTVASRSGYDAAAAESGMPLLVAHPMMWIATDDESEQSLRDRLTAVPALQSVDADMASGLCSGLRRDRVRSGALDPDGMGIEVAGLHQLYLRRLRRHGGRVLTASPVHEVTRLADRWRVTAGADEIAAGVVVNAAGAWVDTIADLAGVRRIGLVPRRRSAFLVPVPPSYTGEAPTWPMIGDASDRWYVKPDGGQLLASPADQAPSEACDARPDDLEIARAIEAINDCMSLAIRHVSTAWAGLRSFVADELPVVGCWDDHPDFFFYAGQGGFGIQMAPALAELGAAILTTGEPPPRLASLGVDAAAVSPQRLVRPTSWVRRSTG